MQKVPPPFTQLLLDVATVAREHGWYLIGVVVLATFGLYRFARTERAVRYWDGIVLDLGLFRKASRALITGRTFRLLSTMLQSGVPLLDAVRLCRASVRNYYFQQLFAAMERDVLNGVGIGPTVTRTSFLPAGVAQMVVTGERSGRLGKVLEVIGEFYEEDGERQVRQVVKLLEPAVIVIMGALVAAVVASVMLPLLNVSTLSS